MDPACCATGAVLVVMSDCIHLGRCARSGATLRCRGQARVRRLFVRAARSCSLAVPPRVAPRRYVVKADSQLVGAFESRPGPLGHMRGGRPVLSYAPQRALLPHPAFEALPAAQLRTRVAVWVLGASGFLPVDELLPCVHGLVLAGGGTGSVPSSVLDALGPALGPPRLPVVVSSRCGSGANHDDFSYRGSLAKYEGRGLLVRGGYELLTPIQARCLLVLRLSAWGHGGVAPGGWSGTA